MISLIDRFYLMAGFVYQTTYLYYSLYDYEKTNRFVFSLGVNGIETQVMHTTVDVHWEAGSNSQWILNGHNLFLTLKPLAS